MKIRNLAILVAALAVVTACGGTDDPTTASKKLDAEQIVPITATAKKLVINNTFGAIKVVGEANRTEIKMTPTLKTGAADDGTILVAESGDTMSVQVNNSSGGTIAVNVVVYTPKKLDFTVNTSGGALDLSGMTGSGVANTGKGDCTVDMDLGTAGKLTVNTSDGDIAVTLPAATQASFSGSAGGGTLTIAAGLNFDSVSAMGNASGDFNGGGDASVTLTATAGNITVNAK